jgi:hypothetical protein
MEVACEDDGEEMVWKAEGRTERKQKRPGKTKHAIPPLLYENQDTDTQEESTIGDLDGMLPRHPLKMVGVVSECQESRSILTKFANCQTLYQASHSLI